MNKLIKQVLNKLEFVQKINKPSLTKLFNLVISLKSTRV
jgi:hypothetical protein